MEDKEFSMFFEVVCCYHPTEYDPVGCDGLYVKEVRKRLAAQQVAEADRAGRLENVAFWARVYVESFGADADSRRSARVGLVDALAALGPAA